MMEEQPEVQVQATEQPAETTTASETKPICEEYGASNGCPKGDECELLHPTAPNGNITKRICEYYMSERGCAKDERCDFLHAYGKPKPKPAPKPCSFYLQERGCVKEDRCEFLHPKAPNGTVTKRICEYNTSQRGCSKGERCDFLHIDRQYLPQQAMGGQYPPMGGMGGPPQYQQQSPYPQYPQWGGGAPAAAPSGPLPALPTKAQEMGNTRVCTFYSSPRGCAKAERCDFIHEASAGGAPQGGGYSQQAPAGYGGGYGQQAPAGYGAYPTSGYPAAGGGGGPTPGRGVCSFYTTSRGCRKGDTCEFVHPVGMMPTQKTAASSRYAPY